MEPAVVTAVDEFARVARGFCDWCEGAVSLAPADVAASVWLAKLHAAALTLPYVEPENEDGLPALPARTAALAKKTLAEFDGLYYREYFDPNPSLADESVVGDVGDDLGDTYKDIRSGLLLYDAGKRAEALWFWSFLHRIHWGRHAVGALFALQCARCFSADERHDV